ncbi:MAG: AmmeMemoRadiSam system radical SAM enzyme [Acidobacteriota bacterium]
MEEAILYTKLSDGKVQCNVCIKRCVIKEKNTGHCGTRIYRDGKLYSLIYGVVASWAISPIEKKPMYHFYPGSLWLSLGSYGCNFRCPGCQNWDISHVQIGKNKNPEKKLSFGEYVSPEELIKNAIKHNCKGISWTYNEPSIWIEYILDGARLAKESGLLTNLVTNGSMTEEALEIISPYLDSMRIDLKGFSQNTYKKIAHIKEFYPILNLIKKAKNEKGIFVEIITNVIPEYNDKENELREIAKWIKENLGEETPWHVTRFFPYLKLSHLTETPIINLEKAREIGREAGLKYVYLGNVPGHPGENTYCPECGRMIIQRFSLSLFEINLNGNKCYFCGNEIHGKF